MNILFPGNYLFPAWGSSNPTPSLDETQIVNNATAPNSSKYFHNFNLRNLNPVYWFYGSSEVNKLDKLYELVECVIVNEANECRQKLQGSRKYFEKKDVKGKNSTIQHNGESSTKKIVTIKPAVQNELPVQVDGGSKVNYSSSSKNSTVTEAIENSTKTTTVPDSTEH